jgi:hypothetical protein
MIEYRFYRVDSTGRIQGPPKHLTGENDDVARVAAKEMVDGCAIEIWDCERKVAYIPRHEE